MKEILLLVLTWLPVPVETVLLIVASGFIKKKVSEATSLPEKQLKATENLKTQVGNLSLLVNKSIELNEQIHKDNVELKMELRGHRNYGKNEVKKN